MEQYAWLLSLPSLIIIALLGMVMHFFKKKIRGESFVEIRDYFRDHFKSTVTALVATILGVLIYYATLQTGQAADLIIAFGSGYTFDSLFNRWDKNGNA